VDAWQRVAISSCDCESTSLTTMMNLPRTWFTNNSKGMDIFKWALMQVATIVMAFDWCQRELAILFGFATVQVVLPPYPSRHLVRWRLPIKSQSHLWEYRDIRRQFTPNYTTHAKRPQWVYPVQTPANWNERSQFKCFSTATNIERFRGTSVYSGFISKWTQMYELLGVAGLKLGYLGSVISRRNSDRLSSLGSRPKLLEPRRTARVCATGVRCSVWL